MISGLARRRRQVPHGLSLAEVQWLYGSEQRWETGQVKALWRDRFKSARCGGQDQNLVEGRPLKR